ncbi:PEP-CTERM sorting domain-containing protein [Massilia genomosp. 1]|nr:PEP-CTERM sorting domain-containing protein [Massilia genomosp. 1]
MNFYLPHAALFALALASAPVHAEGPTTLEASHFSIDSRWAYNTDVIASDANGVTRISMTDAADMAKTSTTLGENGNGYNGMYTITLRPGYRMTGFSVSGTMFGGLGEITTPGGLPGEGTTKNAMKLQFEAYRPEGGTVSAMHADYSMVDGKLPFVLASEPLSVTGTINLSTWTMVNVNSYPYYLPGHPDGPPGREVYPLATMQVLKPTLTIYTSAVPEPETYGMLLAGMAVIGLARRRRRAA